MGIERSKKRLPKPINFEILKGITITSTGAVNINVPLIVNHVNFFPSSFKLNIHQRVIYIDPVIVEKDEPADYILITHSHQDHFSMPDIRNLLKEKTIVICPKAVYKKLSKELNGNNIIEIKPDDNMNFNDIEIEAIGAYNLKSGLIVPHPKSAMNVGYIISFEDIKIYHTGDTDYTASMKQLQNISVVLTPIDGGNLTMTTEKAAEFINHIRPLYVIPMHYNLGSDEINKFKKLINSSTQVIVMDR